MIRADHCELLHPLGHCPAQPEKAMGPELPVIASALAQCGIDAALVDMTRPEFGIPVVRAVAPALQPMPSDTVTDRLRRVLKDCGGGDRHTGGASLIS